MGAIDAERSLKSSVIVVDGNELVLASIGDAFAKYEFYVVEVLNAQEAIEILSVDGENIEVLFSDVHVPGQLSGIELAREVQQRWPWVQIILASDDPKSDTASSGVHLVQKPCDFDSLLPLLCLKHDLPNSELRV